MNSLEEAPEINVRSASCVRQVTGTMANPLLDETALSMCNLISEHVDKLYVGDCSSAAGYTQIEDLWAH